jgi:hypothetical protein
MPVTHFDTTFGIEIECYLPEGGSSGTLANAVSARIGKPVVAEPYNHQNRHHWKIVSDGSLGDYARGVELVSPILPGSNESLAEIEKVVRAIADFGCSVSKRCGLHVHVGIQNACEEGEGMPNGRVPLKMMKRLLKLYAIYEPVIDSVMPPSRRANQNQYCRSMTSISPAAIDAAMNIDAMLRLGGSSSTQGLGRYVKLNLYAFTKYKTAEFRQHAGTLEPSKTRFWILTCLRMVAAARNGVTINPGSGTQPQGDGQAHPVNRARHGSKSWQVGQMMLRPEGVTGPEACAVTGWPSISMPQQATICGLTFTTQRIGRTVRYFARTAQAEVAAAPTAPVTPITLLGFLDLIGADTAEREYLLQRQADLGGPIPWAA